MSEKNPSLLVPWASVSNSLSFPFFTKILMMWPHRLLQRSNETMCKYFQVAKACVNHILLKVVQNMWLWLNYLILEIIINKNVVLKGKLFSGLFFTILLFIPFWLFGPAGMWDVCSSTRDWTFTPCTGRWGLNLWPTREVPQWIPLVEKFEEQTETVTKYWGGRVGTSF